MRRSPRCWSTVRGRYGWWLGSFWAVTRTAGSRVSNPTQYREGRFQTFTVKHGLPAAAITAWLVDREGTLWVVAGVFLSRYQNGRFTSFKPDSEIPVSSARAVCEDANRD